MVYSGHQAYALIGKESTYGTAVTADKDLGLVQSVDVNETNNLNEHFAVGSRAVSDSTAGQYGASISMTARYQSGRILEYLLGGTVTNNDLTGGDYSHVFATGDTIPSMTFEHGFNASTDVVYTFNGVKVNSATFSLDVGGVLEYTADMDAKSVDKTASASAAVIDASLVTFPSFFGAWKTGTASSESTVTFVESASITIDTGLNVHDALGSREHAAATAGNLSVSGSVTLTFDNETEHAIFLGGAAPSTGTPTKKGMILEILNGVAAGSGKQGLTFDLSDAWYTSSSTATTVGDKVTQSFDFWADTIDSITSFDDIAVLN